MTTEAESAQAEAVARPPIQIDTNPIVIELEESETAKGNESEEKVTDKVEETEEDKEPESELEKALRENKKLKNALNYRDKKLSRNSRQLAELPAMARELAELRALRDAPAPKEEDFETYGEHAVAIAEHAADRKYAERELQAKEPQYEQFSAEVIESQKQAMDESETAAKQAFTDFEQVTRNVGRVSQAAWSALTESDSGAFALYSICKEGLLDELNSLTPVRAGMLVQEHLLKAQALAKPKRISQAPEPLAPVKGTGAASKDPSTMTDAEFNAWRRAQIAKRR